MIEHLPIFVYGTLQRGQQRSGLWPCPPQRVQRATTQGRLHDLGPYPALVDGRDVIGGELWHVAQEDIGVTLEALDRIECYGIDAVDLYVRRIVQCRTEEGSLCRAYVYCSAHPEELANVPVVLPGADGVCRWRRQR